MSKRLLLADDSITIQKVIGITFANEDFDLDIVDNGNAAFDKAKAERPDLVLADVYMPGKNGYELCAAIKQDPSLQGVPVLLLSGTFEPFDEDKARQAGADSWIAKPFESQSLIDRVEDLIANATAAPAPVAAEPVAPEVAVEAASVIEPTFESPELEPVTDLGADDVWGDESELDVVEEPFELDEPEVVEEFSAAPAPAVEAVVEEAPAPAVSDDDVWGAVSFDEDELLSDAVTSQPVAEPVAAAPVVEPEEDVATVWEDTEEEIFDLDDEDVIDEGDLLLEDEPIEPIEEPFSVEDAFDVPAEPAPSLEPVAPAFEPEAVVPEPEAAPVAAAQPETEIFAAPEPVAEEPVFEAPREEDPFAAVDMEPLVEEAPSFAEVEPEPVLDNVAFADEPVVEPEPVIEPEAVVAPATTVEVVEAQAAGLSEDQLDEIVERVAGAVIERLAGSVLEKVAWEVVPDLAENFIKEEIRKIKEAV